jgi:hypothetical protein
MPGGEFAVDWILGIAGRGFEERLPEEWMDAVAVPFQAILVTRGGPRIVGGCLVDVFQKVVDHLAGNGCFFAEVETQGLKMVPRAATIGKLHLLLQCLILSLVFAAVSS